MSHQASIRSGQITQACLNNGMGGPDAAETAAVLLPVLDAMLAQAWDEGLEAGEDRGAEQVLTGQAKRRPTNPYTTKGA